MRGSEHASARPSALPGGVGSPRRVRLGRGGLLYLEVACATRIANGRVRLEGRRLMRTHGGALLEPTHRTSIGSRPVERGRRAAPPALRDWRGHGAALHIRQRHEDRKRIRVVAPATIVAVSTRASAPGGGLCPGEIHSSHSPGSKTGSSPGERSKAAER